MCHQDRGSHGGIRNGPDRYAPGIRAGGDEGKRQTNLNRTSGELREGRGSFLLYRKLRPIKQNPPGDAHYAQRKMAAVAAALRRESPARRTLCSSVEIAAGNLV